ncbi:MAG: TolC family protein [Bacteroidetes bacterium]|nr:TolC family protein [Bacteroidota bacterium]
MKRIIFLVAFISFYCTISQINAQTGKVMSMTLKEAQDYAYENNFDLKNSANDVKIAQKMVKQNTAIGLPQVDGGIDYMDYLALPTSLIPGEFIGQPGTFFPVQFGSEYNATVRGRVTQLLYSGQYIVGLQTAKAYLETAKQKMIRDKMDVKDLVAEAYISFLIVEESTRILDSTFKTVNQLVEEGKATLKQGLIEDIDVEQMELNRSNLEASIITTKSQRLLAYNYLRFLIGLKDNQELVLTDNLDFFMKNVQKDVLINQQFDYDHNIDYTILKKQEYLVLMQYKLSKTAYHPTLSGFFGASANAQRNDWNFTSDAYPWYKTVNWGLTLSVPIWSSGSRKYAVDQARLNVDKMKVNDEKMRMQLELQVETLKKDFNNSYLVFQNKQKGLDMANRIYEKTFKKYRLGVSSSTDLNQKYSQFLISESDYIQSLFDLLKNRIRLAKLLEKV